MSKLFCNILGAVRDTPIIKINRLSPDGINMYVKAEGFNPMGSVKDRMAVSTIEAAEASDQLKPGQTVIEATSGHTGIGLAMVCAVKGYPLVATMAENFSLERRKILLAEQSIQMKDMPEDFEPLSLLPDWLHQR